MSKVSGIVERSGLAHARVSSGGRDALRLNAFLDVLQVACNSKILRVSLHFQRVCTAIGQLRIYSHSPRPLLRHVPVFTAQRNCSIVVRSKSTKSQANGVSIGLHLQFYLRHYRENHMQHSDQVIRPSVAEETAVKMRPKKWPLSSTSSSSK